MNKKKFISLLISIATVTMIDAATTADLSPTDDIAIANAQAMTYNAGGLNDGNHEWISVVNYTC